MQNNLKPETLPFGFRFYAIVGSKIISENLNPFHNFSDCDTSNFIIHVGNKFKTHFIIQDILGTESIIRQPTKHVYRRRKFVKSLDIKRSGTVVRLLLTYQLLNQFNYKVNHYTRSDADPDPLAKYVLALIKKQLTIEELENLCTDKLNVFLQNSKC